MFLLILGLVLFLGLHLLPVFSGIKAALQQKLGAGAYRGLFSFLSLAGLVLIVVGYGEARSEGPAVLYDPPFFLRHLMMLLMLPVFILFVASGAPGHIKKIVKHPQILAVKIWAFSHLLANGELPSVLLFGSFLAWGVVGRISMKKRDRLSGATAQPASEARVAADLISVAGGLVIYGLFVWKLHTWLIGVPVI